MFPFPLEASSNTKLCLAEEYLNAWLTENVQTTSTSCMLSLPPPNHGLNCSYIAWKLLLRWKLPTWPSSCCSHLCSFSNASRLLEVITPMTKGQSVRLCSGNIHDNEAFFLESHTSIPPPSTDSYTTVAFTLHGKLDLNHAVKTGYAVYEHEFSNSLQTASFAWF